MVVDSEILARSGIAFGDEQFIVVGSDVLNTGNFGSGQSLLVEQIVFAQDMHGIVGIAGVEESGVIDNSGIVGEIAEDGIKAIVIFGCGIIGAKLDLIARSAKAAAF